MRVEVSARFHGTLVDVVRLPAGGTYRVGTAPGVDLAVAPLSAFPVVDGTLVRRPVGIAATVITGDGAAEMTASELRLAGGTTVRMRFGAVELDVVLTAPDAPLPRPRLERRLALFGLASLCLHLAIWFAAMTRLPLEQLAAPRARPVHVAHVQADRLPQLAHRPPVTPRTATGHPAELLAPEVGRPARSPSRGAGAAGGGPGGEEAAGDHAHGDALSRLRDAVASVTATNPEADARAWGDGATSLDPDATEGAGFGGGRRFDPTQRADLASVATGTYATVASGHGAGDDYDLPAERPGPPPPAIEMCVSADCVVSGSTGKRAIRGKLQQHLAAIAACYREHADPRHGAVMLDFEIGADGTVRDAHGSGLGNAGPCIADVIGAIAFAPMLKPTQVHYPLRFRPT